MDPAPFLSCRALGCAEEERKQPEHCCIRIAHERERSDRRPIATNAAH